METKISFYKILSLYGFANVKCWGLLNLIKRSEQKFYAWTGILISLFSVKFYDIFFFLYLPTSKIRVNRNILFSGLHTFQTSTINIFWILSTKCSIMLDIVCNWRLHFIHEVIVRKIFSMFFKYLSATCTYTCVCVPV